LEVGVLFYRVSYLFSFCCKLCHTRLLTLLVPLPDNLEKNHLPQSTLVNTLSNSSLNRDNLVNLIAKIEIEEKTIWPDLHQKMIMKELREFAQRLQNWSIEYQSSLLQHYVNQLKTNLLDFDGENLEKTVQNFPHLRVALIAELEQYQEPHSLEC
jgi:lambda repressor-like predicted transcriptional regulator